MSKCISSRYVKITPRRWEAIPEGLTSCLELRSLSYSLKNNLDMARGSYVYAIRAGDKVKFGCSASPWPRLRSIQIDNHNTCKLILVIDCGQTFSKTGVEKAVHATLGAARVRGEWFETNHPGVHRMMYKPWTLPWKVIEGMARLGLRNNVAREQEIESLKARFFARGITRETLY